MAKRNPLTDSRSQDSIFEQDVARSNRERGNQKKHDSSKTLKRQIITGVITFVVTYLIIGFALGIINMLLVQSFSQSEIFKGLIKGYAGRTYISIIFDWLIGFGWQMLITTMGASILTGMTVYMMSKRAKKQALTEDHTDINSFKGDRHILTLEEAVMQYPIFPDAGAHSKSVSPSSIVGHFYLTNSSRLPKVKLAKRDPETGEFIKDENGMNILEEFPLFDDNLRNAAYTSVGVKDKKDQIAFDPFKLKHKKIFEDDINHKKAIKKWEESGKKGPKPEKKYTGKFKWQTVGDFIKEDWYIPSYENQRPAGAFLVETGAVNTFAIAITRGNKGQLVVNNTIDMLSREHDLQNMFVNDPKGELFAGFHKMLEMRGYEVIVLNLMEPQKTHQFNVLGPAIAMARIGNYDKMRDLLSTIMNAFFPVEGDDPFWGNAQQTLVKMIIFSMIDYYLEEERAYLQRNVGVKDESTIARDLDDMWSHVTMFNAYQMLTTMSRQEVKFELKDPSEEPDYDEDDEESTDGESNEQMTQLTAFFKLLDALPKNKMRTIAMQQIDAMDLMAESEKTRATVYGIALVAMLFFTDGPITAITSASPRQSLDTVSLAFPRRLRFKLNSSFLQAHKLSGNKVVFESYYDEAMEHKLPGKDFEHETKLDALGWVEYRFKGIYENYDEFKEDDGSITKIAKPVYIRMIIQNNTSGYKMYEFNFKFSRGHARTVDGRKFVQNPRTGERIEQGGTLRQGHVENGKFIVGKLDKVRLANGMKVMPIEQTDPVYNIRPKAIFSITPPHLTDYIKVVIVMVAVLFDTSVGESYITKANGKPFYKTRSILDELGNMQFNGNGIPEFQTKLSIGLGQGLHSCPAYL